jgi:hypothetical protein
MYYWSLLGAWYILWDQTGNDSGLTYSYLFDKLFPINLNFEYFQTIILYSAFIITVLITLCFYLSRRQIIVTSPPSTSRITILSISHGRLLFVSIFSMLCSYAIFSSDLSLAAQLEQTGYQYTRSGDNSLFTLASILNRMSIVPLFIGVVVAFTSKNAQLITARNTRLRERIIYIITVVLAFYYVSLLGNKNEMFLGLVSAVLFLFANSRRPKYLLVSVLAFIGLLLISLIDILRGIPVLYWSEELSHVDLSAVVQIPFRSNEMFGAHFSLYGAIFYQLPINWGYSIYSLVCSVIPRFLWENRPFDIYYYYVDGVMAAGGQGYTIHHAAGWYLNFGFLGIILGAFIYGRVWAWIYNGYLNHLSLGSANKLKAMFFSITPWTLVGGTASMIRSGPEAYKGLFFDCVFCVIVPLYFALVRNNKVSK